MELQLLEDPKSGEVFLYVPECDVAYKIDGTPLGCSPEWAASCERVDKVEVPSLFDWQKDPGYFSDAFYVQATLRNLSAHFTVGGSFLYIMTWAGDFEFTVTCHACFRDRNVARRGVDVEW